MTGVPPTGWYVEIDDPKSGNTWRPEILDDPQTKPTAIDFPRITIPVRKRDRWFDTRFEGAPMRVWIDGKRQPIDQLDDVTETERGLELHGRGAVELEQRKQLEVDSKNAHEVVEDLIANETSYTPNVDDPDAVVRENVQVLSADSTTEWQDNTESIPSTLPIQIQNGKVTTQQSAFHAEGEEFQLTATVSDADSSEGEFENIGSSLDDTVFVSVPYTIPADKVGLAMRYRNPSDPDSDGDHEGHGFRVEVDGETVFEFVNDWTGSSSYTWLRDESGLSSDVSGSTSITVNAADGYYTDTDNDGTDEFVSYDGNETNLDLIVLYDTRYDYTFDNSVDSNSLLTGPQTKPDLEEIETKNGLTSFQFSGGRVESSFDDTSNKQRIGVSQDNGQTWTYSNNTETLETDFNSGSATLRAKFGLSRYGSRDTETPTTGFKSQSVDLFRLKGDIDETPLLVNQEYDAQLIEIIKDIAEYGDFIGEYRKQNGTPTWEFTKVGQRVSDRTPTASSYEYRKSVSQQVDKVVIKSGRQQVRQEEFTANHGAAVDLDNSRIDRGTESVYDPQTGTEYVEGEDYQLSPGIETTPATITTLSTGNISDGQSLAVDYSHHLEAVSTVANPGSNPNVLVETFPQLTTQRSIDQAAVLLRRQLDEPLKEATVTLSADEVGFDVVSTQAFEALPTDEPLEIREITNTARETTFRLGTRESIGEAVSRLRRRLSAATQRV